MVYTVEWEDDAIEELKDILAYLRQFYPGTSKRFSAALKEKLMALRDMPYMYPVYEDNPAYRKMGVLKYMVFYQVNDAEQTIVVHRILHGSRDLTRHLP
jgi:plasmid stabilization system protein ParE